MSFRVYGFDTDGCFPVVGGRSVLRKDAETVYAAYCGFFGTAQSLDRLRERGGFWPDEFACLMNGVRPDSRRVENCPECRGTGEVCQSDEGGIWYKCGKCWGCGKVLKRD